MLKPSNDRLDYSKMLTPPYGYKTVFAVGTTYSLDLDALIGVSIALGLSESIDSELKDNPIYLLEALQKTTDKVLIFCEGGQIKVPPKHNQLYILLEKMVCEIVMKNKKSFHPKFWLVKYENEEGEVLYRCLILSRNLTFDRSWDVAASIHGRMTVEDRLEDGYEKSKPISDFLQALLKLSRKNEIDPYKKKMMNSLANEILNVKFQLNEKQFNDYSFCPIGIDGYDIKNTGLFNSYHEIFVISPFVTESIINELNQLALTNPVPNTLVTRRSELPKLKPETITNFDIYVMKDLIVDGEEALSEGKDNQQEESQRQDIHAKLYLKTKYADSELYMGSLNATKSASYGNIEFMFKLQGKRRYLNVEQLKKDIFGENDKDNPFEKLEIKLQEGPEKSESDVLEKVIKEICRLKSSASVIGQESPFSLEVRFEQPLDIGCDVYISPLLSNKEEQLKDTVIFEDLKLLQLSEFYIIRVASGEENLKRVIKIKTHDMPEARESSVVNHVIKDKNGFIQYITFLLGEDYLLSMLENINNIKNGFVFGNGEPIPALYEKMLKAAVHSPGKFDEIKRLLSLISDERIIPDGFKELYEVFNEVVDKKCR